VPDLMSCGYEGKVETAGAWLGNVVEISSGGFISGSEAGGRAKCRRDVGNIENVLSFSLE